MEKRACNSENCPILNLSSFTNLKLLTIGDFAFANVREVRIVGLNRLKIVVVGWKCFRQLVSDGSNRCFYLKNCGKLRELMIECGAFEEFTVCEMDNLASLEVIDIGTMSKWSANFYHASLELRSDGDGMN